jgi:ribosome recycling factor
MEDVDSILLDTEDRMDKSISVYRESLSKIRTGKASIGLFEGIKVNMYGTEMPLDQCSNILTPEARLIVIQPYDKNAIPVIEKAILTSDLGLNPINDGTVVRINIPPLTEERRKELVKVVHRYAEDTRQSVRQVRRDSNEKLKKLEKASEISEDIMHDRLADVQEMTDAHVKQVDEILAEKEKEVLEI